MSAMDADEFDRPEMMLLGITADARTRGLRWDRRWVRTLLRHGRKNCDLPF